MNNEVDSMMKCSDNRKMSGFKLEHAELKDAAATSPRSFEIEQKLELSDQASNSISCNSDSEDYKNLNEDDEPPKAV